MSLVNERVEHALRELQQGKMIILADDPGRENEGDLIIAAEKITPAIMNFIIRHSSGIVCISLDEEKLQQLELPLMVPAHENSSTRGTPFTVSIDAREGISTGVSAEDRATTILKVVQDGVKPDELVKPGHIFPLQARRGGVLERQGHTEGSLDLVKLAGLKPVAVLCEIMNPDGTMTRGEQLEVFAAEHDIYMLNINDIVTYRLSRENTIKAEASALLPLDPYGIFNITALKEQLSDHEHIVLTKQPIGDTPVLVRIHSSCMTGDLFGSMRCDCHAQLHYSLQQISEHGGILFYLNQEGRGVGIFNKIRAYHLQDKGLDTVEANKELGLPVDARSYHLAATYLRQHGVTNIRLMTNNPDKIAQLKKFGIEQVERQAMPVFQCASNINYLQTKKEKLQHTFDLKNIAI